MKKQIIALGALLMISAVNAQMQYEPESDTLRIQQIEDINLHKTGNPNKARPMSSKSNFDSSIWLRNLSISSILNFV